MEWAYPTEPAFLIAVTPVPGEYVLLYVVGSQKKLNQVARSYALNVS